MHQDNGHQDNRHHSRIEPPFMDAIIKDTMSNDPRFVPMNGRVLDISRSGMAIALSEDAVLPPEGVTVNIEIQNDQNGIPATTRKATLQRTWSEAGGLNEGRGISVKFDDELPRQGPLDELFCGITQEARLESQAKLAAQDINYLGNYRHNLVDCQMKLFVLALTMGVALAGAYFGLTYHSVATQQMENPMLGFWRTMLASLPGLLAVACALMVAQKNIAIQRIDAYLAVLKECSIGGQYPREYKGWETNYRKFRYILKTSKCDDCEVTRKCGHIPHKEQSVLKARGMFTNPRNDLYQVIMNMSFFVMVSLSVIALITSLLRFQWDGIWHMVSAVVIMAVLVCTMAYLFYLYYQLRRGVFSMEYFKIRWLNLLSKCREVV